MTVKLSKLSQHTKKRQLIDSWIQTSTGIMFNCLCNPKGRRARVFSSLCVLMKA